jgi:hypothetical protein
MTWRGIFLGNYENTLPPFIPDDFNPLTHFNERLRVAT